MSSTPAWRVAWWNCCRFLAGRIDGLVERLVELEERQGAVETMAHTRMQAALPVPAARKIRSWPRAAGASPRPHDGARKRHRDPAFRRRGSVRSTSSATRVSASRGDWRQSSACGRWCAPRHTERDGQAMLANWLSMVTGSLGKMGQDIALLAQTEVGEIKLAAGGGSSAMPHKVNPVGAEVLVALARFNATLVSAMHQSLIHEGGSAPELRGRSNG